MGAMTIRGRKTCEQQYSCWAQQQFSTVLRFCGENEQQQPKKKSSYGTKIMSSRDYCGNWWNQKPDSYYKFF